MGIGMEVDQKEVVCFPDGPSSFESSWLQSPANPQFDIERVLHKN